MPGYGFGEVTLTRTPTPTPTLTLTPTPTLTSNPNPSPNPNQGGEGVGYYRRPDARDLGTNRLVQLVGAPAQSIKLKRKVHFMIMIHVRRQRVAYLTLQALH